MFSNVMVCNDMKVSNLRVIEYLNDRELDFLKASLTSDLLLTHKHDSALSFEHDIDLQAIFWLVINCYE